MKVKKVNYDETWESGCETCDWGSSYVNEIEIILEDDTYANIKVDKMYDYTLSESDYMQLIANSSCLEELIMNILNLIETRRYDGDVDFLIDFEDLTVTLNGEKVNVSKSLEKGRIIKEA